jgi:hypothetical protein
MQLVSLTKGIYLNFSSCIFEQLSEDRVKGTSSIHQSLGQDFENDKKTLGRLFVSFLLVCCPYHFIFEQTRFFFLIVSLFGTPRDAWSLSNGVYNS